MLAGLADLIAGNDHFEFYWFPYTDRAQVKTNNRVPVSDQPLRRLRGWLDDDFLSNTVFAGACRLGRPVPALVPSISADLRPGADRAQLHRPLRPGLLHRRAGCASSRWSTACPAPRCGEALAALRRIIDGLPFKVLFPVEVRFTAADDIWLSHGYGRESAYVAIHQYAGAPYEPYFRAFEKVAAGLGGRPHWGKLHYRDAASLRAGYPRFDDFLRGPRHASTRTGSSPTTTPTRSSAPEPDQGFRAGQRQRRPGGAVRSGQTATPLPAEGRSAASVLADHSAAGVAFAAAAFFGAAFFAAALRGGVSASESAVAAVFFAVVFFAVVFFAVVFFAGGLLGAAFFFGAGPFARFSASISEASLERQRLRRLTAAQRRVVLAVGDVRAEAAVLDDQRLLGQRVDAHLAQRRRGRPALAGLRRGQQRQRLVQRDGEHLLLGLQRAEVVAPLDVRAVAAVVGEDLVAVGVRADQPGQGQQRSASSRVSVSGDWERSSDDLRSPLATYGP